MTARRNTLRAAVTAAVLALTAATAVGAVRAARTRIGDPG